MLHSPPHLLSSTTTLLPHISLHPKFHFLKTPTKPYNYLSQQFPTTLHLSHPLLAQLSDIPTSPTDGPVELPFSLPSFISNDDDPSTIQVATSVLLTGAVSVFLFRALRRRAKRAKELVHFSLSLPQTLKIRSSGFKGCLGKGCKQIGPSSKKFGMWAWLVYRLLGSSFSSFSKLCWSLNSNILLLLELEFDAYLII